MANANTAGKLSLPETVSVSKILMRIDALRQMLFEAKILLISEQSFLWCKCCIQRSVHSVDFLTHIRNGHGGKRAFR